MIPGLTKIKALVAVSVVLMMIIGALGWQLRSELQANARLETETEHLESVNAENLKTMEKMRREKKRLEKTLAERTKRLEEIERRAGEKEKQLREKLERLRGKYESIDEYMSVPVPDEFVDKWMRARAADGDKSENRAD